MWDFLNFFGVDVRIRWDIKFVDLWWNRVSPDNLKAGFDLSAYFLNRLYRRTLELCPCSYFVHLRGLILAFCTSLRYFVRLTLAVNADFRSFWRHDVFPNISVFPELGRLPVIVGGLFVIYLASIRHVRAILRASSQRPTAGVVSDLGHLCRCILFCSCARRSGSLPFLRRISPGGLGVLLVGHWHQIARIWWVFIREVFDGRGMRHHYLALDFVLHCLRERAVIHTFDALLVSYANFWLMLTQLH